jgi:hypothetical protein
LHGVDANSVTITAQWLDASNDVGARVRVTVSTPYSPTLTSLFGNLTLTLRATSTLPVARLHRNQIAQLYNLRKRTMD